MLSSKPQAPAAPATATTHTNFIVLGHARCGSNLLVRALGEHPQTRMVSEVLSPHASAREAGWNNANRLAWSTPRGEGYHVGEDGAEFLQEKVFGSGPSRNIRAYGFKLFYDHARFDEHSATAWDYILARRDIRIIHVVRRNLLHALLAHEIALRTKHWHRLIEDADPVPPRLPAFALEPEMCLRYFDQIAAWRSWADTALANHSMVKVEYDKDVSGDFSGTNFRVQEFLGIVPWHVNPDIAKLQTISARQQIANFDQLRERFEGSMYAEFFADEDSR